jgi:adenosylcobinamide-phosphate guanylyltransferase
MDALLMCGGRGTRLDAAIEKPLLEISGRPMVDRVRTALSVSRIETTHAVVSPHAPATHAHLADAVLPLIVTPGDGYVADLDHALSHVERPVLTVAADLPLLDAETVNGVLDTYDERSATAVESSASPSLAVCVPVTLKHQLGVSTDSSMERAGQELASTGINVVAGEADAMHTVDDVRLAVNVNHRRDAQVAEALL